MKIQELRELTIDELQQKLEDFPGRVVQFKVQKSMNRLENTNRIVEVKKSVARINTLITELNTDGSK